MYNEENKIYIADGVASCWAFTEEFREDIWCSTIGYGDSVLVYSNSVYELPPDDSQYFHPYWGLGSS